MPKKKLLNWTDIQVLYESGTPNRIICQQYDVNTKQISNRANREGWRRSKIEKKQEILETAHETQLNTLAELCSLTDRVHLDFMRKFYQKAENDQTILDQITNPYLFDGEKVNTLFNTAMNNATKIRMAQFKQVEAPNEEPPPPDEVNPLEAIEAIKRITSE